ncbi:hypothetical protein CBR_g3752 [Chara braunii]|uniref:Uncharacterized protein n=1 Tax=Chara braunii TaxID=69332 RepID=A0A388KG62_CHABU|nr:hypothetical protein CBR_g3752 [Chara braunii]|eukprot:GBG69054.1 hypothetical protein CBR_g3752 [Chara braunii]
MRSRRHSVDFRSRFESNAPLIYSHYERQSALDGNINFWQVGKQGKEITGKGYLPAMSEKQHWPEDISWHPTGRRIVAVYSADQNDTQVAVIKNSVDKKPKITFLPNKPHDRGLLNSVVFLAWDDYSHFITGGSDHGVAMWSATEDSKELKVKMIHRDVHSSAVSGVDGLRHRAIILSGGMDKRICGFDPKRDRAIYLKILDNKIVSVMLNPQDDNLFLVQLGTKERQLRLFDFRSDRRELHSFGWQQSSDTLSALIRPSWSPNGLYIATGSSDPKLHVFDIRYTGRSPAQTISVHTKRVLRVEWHPTWPLLTSISSDLCIGMHSFQN